MAVKMRLMRMGKKKTPSYRVVVVDGRAPRDGRYIEQIGRYDPQQDPSLVEIDNEKAASWLSKGAQPTEAVEKLLNISGAMIYLDADGRQTGYEDVFSKIDMCRRHYVEVGLGASYVDQFVR